MTRRFGPPALRAAASRAVPGVLPGLVLVARRARALLDLLESTLRRSGATDREDREADLPDGEALDRAIIVDALRDRSRAGADEESDAEVTDDTDMAETTSDVEDYPDEPPIADYQDDAVPTEDESDTVAAEPSSTEGDNGDTARN